MSKVSHDDLKAAITVTHDEVMRMPNRTELSYEELVAIASGSLLMQLPDEKSDLMLSIARNYVAPFLLAQIHPEPPAVEELRAHAEELAQSIAADRIANPGPVLVRSRDRPWLYRAVRFPQTMRKFERVYFAGGAGFLERWRTAFVMARLTVRKIRGAA